MLNTSSTNNTTATVLRGFEFQISYLRQCNTFPIVWVFKDIEGLLKHFPSEIKNGL